MMMIMIVRHGQTTKMTKMIIRTNRDQRTVIETVTGTVTMTLNMIGAATEIENDQPRTKDTTMMIDEPTTLKSVDRIPIAENISTTHRPKVENVNLMIVVRR